MNGPARPGRTHTLAVWRMVPGLGKGDKPRPVEWWCVYCKARFTKRRGNGHCPVMSKYA